jgi:hypothetical protein
VTQNNGHGDVVVEKVVTGHAHCGMVASARWIGQRAGGVLEEGLRANPGYRLKIVGHSLGGGTASLLAYSLREKAAFAGTEVVAFAPGKEQRGRHFLLSLSIRRFSVLQSVKNERWRHMFSTFGFVGIERPGRICSS